MSAGSQGRGRLHGKVALVTGSSRGIGAAIAQLFAAEGARVVVHGRDAEAMSEVRTRIERAGGRAIQVAADVTQLREVEELRRRVEEALGPVHVLVANAGGAHAVGPIEEVTEESWRESVEANLTATFLVVKAFLPGMKARGTGVIVTMSSGAARLGHAQAPVAYAAAKAGIEALTRIVAAQAGPAGVRVCGLAPEAILTERNRRRIPEATQASLARAHPLQRLGTPEDVAHAALFLASEEASWITGVVVDVAGGALMR